MVCKVLSLPKIYYIPRSVFCDTSCVLTWIYMSIGNSCLSLVATLKDPSKVDGASWMPREILIS